MHFDDNISETKIVKKTACNVLKLQKYSSQFYSVWSDNRILYFLYAGRTTGSYEMNKPTTCYIAESNR